MKIYTIVAGVNGCGKSSLTGVLRTEIDNLGKIIDVDKITAACGGNLLEGGKKAVALIDECLEKEICFTQETTLSGRKTLDTVKRAIAKDYYIRLYYVGLDTMEESLLRIENRVKRGGHNINTDTVANCFSKRFEDLLTILPIATRLLSTITTTALLLLRSTRTENCIPLDKIVPSGF